jgi:hypothetical protein
MNLEAGLIGQPSHNLMIGRMLLIIRLEWDVFGEPMFFSASRWGWRWGLLACEDLLAIETVRGRMTEPLLLVRLIRYCFLLAPPPIPEGRPGRHRVTVVGLQHPKTVSQQFR